MSGAGILAQLSGVSRSIWSWISPQISYLPCAVGSYFLTQRIHAFSGEVLWIPADWVSVAVGLGLVVGLSCYHLARFHLPRPKQELGLTPPPGDREREAWKIQRDRYSKQSRKMAILFSAVTLVTLIPNGIIRSHSVVSWETDVGKVQGVFGKDDFRTISPPFYFASKDLPSATVVFPFGFPTSAKGREYVADLRAVYEDGREVDVRMRALDEFTWDLVDLLRVEEAPGLFWSNLAMITGYILFLASLSFAYGYSMNIVAEILGHA